MRMMLANPDVELSEKAVRLDPHFINVLPTIKPCAYAQVAVNTTTGTGAEMTGFAVVTDWAAHWKYVVIAANMIPTVGILDPALLRTMPERIAAQSGIDLLRSRDGRIRVSGRESSGKGGRRLLGAHVLGEPSGIYVQSP